MTASRRMTAALAAALALAALAESAHAATARTDASAYAKHCQNQSKKRVAGAKRTAFSTCVTAMARLARARTRSATNACATMSRRRSGARRSSPFQKCLAAAKRLVRHGNGVDRSYVEEMIVHHIGAVEMAQLALQRGQTPYVRGLAQSIITSQTAEITRMRGMAARLVAAGIPRVRLGLTKRQMGMDHDMSHLVGADPFDVHFVDMMIPHHQGAITMSRVLFAKGAGAATRQLAEQIVVAQTREIEQMRNFRAALTGAPAPTPGAGADGHPH